MTAARFYSSTSGSMELQADITDSSTTMSVDSVVGLPGTTPFTLVIDPGNSEEIVDVTGVAGLVLTITRGVDSSAAQAHLAGVTIRHMATARDFRDAQEHIGASADVHGVGASSDVVGTETSQTLTNKTLQASAAGVQGAIVKGFASQTAAYLDIQDSTGTTVVKAVPGQDSLQVSGTTGINSSGIAAIYHYIAKFTATDASAVGLILKAAASQTADLLQVQNSAGTTLAKFDKDGKLTAPQVTSSGTITGTTGTFTSVASSGAVSGTTGTFTGQVQSNSLDVVTLSESQTLTNKTLTSPATTGLTGDTGAFSGAVSVGSLTKGTVDIFDPPRVHAVQNTATSLTSGVWTLITFDHADVYDTDSMHDPASNNSRIVIGTTGLYHVQFSVGVSFTGSGGAGIRLLQVEKNAAGVHGGGTLTFEDRSFASNSSFSTELTAGGDIFLTAGDYLEAFVDQNSGATLTTSVSTYFTYAQARWVAPS